MENEKFIGVVPIHGDTKIVIADKLEALREKIEEVLKPEERNYPGYDFRSHILYFKGVLIKEEKSEDSNK